MAVRETVAQAIEAETLDPTSLPHATKIQILIAVLIGLFLAALDQTIVSTALPAIVRDFQGIDMVGWISTGYLLASTATIPIYGKLSDMFGRKIIIQWGIIVFLIGSMLCGIAGSMLQLVIFRIIQGIGAAAITSTAFSTPADLFVPAERPKYMGIFGMIFGLSSVIGPFLGGLLTDKLSWHWVFFVNLPIGLIAFAFIYFKMPTIRYGVKAKIDWLGTILLILAVVSLMLGLSLDKTLYPWGSPLIIGMFILAIVSLVAFIWVETKVPSPIISLGLFKNKIFSIGVIVSILHGAAFFGAIIFLSLYLVNVLGLSATEAGTTQIPLMGGFVLSSNIASMLVQRTGRYKPIMVSGFALALVGFVLMAFLGPDSTVWDVIWREFLLGLGLGPAIPLLNLAVQNATPRRDLGAVTANRQFFQQLGQAFAAALFTVVLVSNLSTQLVARFAPVTQELSPALAAAIKPEAFRNVSTSEGAGSDGLDISNTISGSLIAHLETVRSQAQLALGQGDANARAQLLADTQLSSELQSLIVATTTTDQAALQQALTIIDGEEAALNSEAQQAAPKIERAVKEAYSASITNIYWYSTVLEVIVLLIIILMLPELPLSREVDHTQPAMAE